MSATVEKGIMPILTVEGNLAHFRAHGAPTADELRMAMGYVGRRENPYLLFLLDVHGLLTTEALVANICDAWSDPEFPERSIPKRVWRGWFERTGFVADGQRAERPTKALPLFRGCSARHALGWSWTADVEIARWFASRSTLFSRYGDTGVVFRAVVEPRRLYLRNFEQRNESEYVIDTRRLGPEQLRVTS